MRNWAVCFILVLCSIAEPILGSHRVALVIGNSQYPGKDAIPAVARDARNVAKLLEERQFRVTTALDRPRDELRTLLQTFIDSSPVNGTALIYFGGYSMTVKDNQGVFQGLLLTVDGNRKAIVLGELVEEVGISSAAKSTVILIDSGQGLPPGYDERRGPPGLNAFEKLPDGVSLNFAMEPNTWAAQPGAIAKRLAESKNPGLEAWLGEASSWQLSNCKPGSISTPPSKAISSPQTLVAGKKAGDEWVSPHGTVFCWCPDNDGQPGFWIGKYEARQSKFPLKSKLIHRNHPAHSLRQKDLANLLVTLTETEQKAGRLPKGWEYTLPSPNQWEYAARAGTKGARYFQDETHLPQHANFADRSLLATGDDYYSYAESTAGMDDGFARLAPVGSFAPNPWGLHDVFGNVWEQTSTGELCGGSWVSPKEYLKAELRKPPPSHPQKPTQIFPYTSEYVGFRLIIRHMD